MEIVMVVVLIVLAMLLGVLFGGGTVWYLKPSSETKVIDRVVNKFVCSDGAVKDSQADCPFVKTTGGKTELVCPPCDCPDQTGSVYRKCDCIQCSAQCGTGLSIMTTTTIHVPVCDACSQDADCGTEYLGDLRCRKDKEYKMKNIPICGDGCCKVRQEMITLRSCTSDERCVSNQGCVFTPEDDE